MATQTKQFQISVSDDKMHVFLESVPLPEDMEALADELLTALADYGIKPLPERPKLIAALNEAPKSETMISRAEVATGIIPVEPVNARLLWEGDFFSPGFAVDSRTGKIDYRRRAAQPEVKPDQLLARLTPAKPGIDGADVFGHRLHVSRPTRHSVRPGRNARAVTEGDGTVLFYAMISGRVRWDMKIISVDDVFRVAGDVNMESGNIRHNGAVAVDGDVKSGFMIEAEGDVEVKGTVEGANIRSGGSILVSGGISGGRSAGRSIRAKGSVHAKFILDARVEAGADIVVEKEIVNATVMTHGDIHIPSGIIVGGDTWAVRSISAGQCGSERGTATQVTAGCNPLLERRIGELTLQKAGFLEEMERIEVATAPKIEVLSALTGTQRRLMTDLLTRSAVCFAQVETIDEEIEALKLRLAEICKPVIQIEGAVNAETTIRLKNSILLLHNAMIGPIRFYLQRDEVRFELIREPEGQ